MWHSHSLRNWPSRVPVRTGTYCIMMYGERKRGPEDRERSMMKEGREMVETRMRDHTDGEDDKKRRKTTEQSLLKRKR